MDPCLDDKTFTPADITGQPLKICILGQPFWGTRFKETLEKYVGYAVDVSTLFPQQLPSSAEWKKATQADILIRVGYRPGARTIPGQIFELFWKAFRKFNSDSKVVYYWIGTDVLNALKDFRSKSGPTAFFNESKNDIHYVDAPWLNHELAEMGIQATQIHFPAPILRSESVLPTPESFSVLTYIPDRRYRFYDGPTIYAAAKRLPHVTFNVVAGKGSWVTNPLPNLNFLGWRNDMESIYNQTALVVRLAHHDALGCMVQEGLGFSKHVIYSYAYPHCIHVDWNSPENFILEVEKLEKLHREGKMLPNVDGWKYAMKEFNEEDFSKNLLESFYEFRKELTHE